MREALKRTLKFRALEPIRYVIDHGRARASGAPPSIRLLIASDDRVYTSEQQFAPLRTNRGRLRDEHGIVLAHVLTKDALALPPPLLRTYHAILLKLGFRTEERDALTIARRLRERAGPRVRIVYCDGDDDLCVLWPDLLAHVDLYVKKHVFADRRAYLSGRIGKTNLTDYVARTFGVSFERDIIPISRPVPEAQLHKIVLGWNVGLDDKITSLYRRAEREVIDAPKDVDVVCRASVARDWIRPLRASVIPILRRLEPEHRVLTPEQRVSQEEYYREMLRARICVSPFGYGEICWRDFEAVLCGCLLVKPDVSHLRTEPDIFVPHETYVPVRWDFSDLEEVLRRYLARPSERARVCKNAFDALSAYYDRGGFDRSVSRVLRAAGLGPERAGAAALGGGTR